MKKSNFLLLLVLFLGTPAYAASQVATVVFTNSTQSIGIGVPSAALTLGVQGVDGTPAGGISQTGCIALTSASPTGKFSSSATNWNPVSILTMNKGTSNRNFFYQDTTAGTYTLTATFALKPTDVTDPCASWPQPEWQHSLQASQVIAVGDTASQSVPSSDDTYSQDDASPQTPSTTQQITTSSNVGSEILTTTIQSQPVVNVGAGSFFTVSASDSHGRMGSDTRYVWNFGDGSIKEGQTAFHTYTYPGTYIVLVSVGSGDKSGIGRATIQAVPAQIGMLIGPDGSIVLSNQASQELNIGLWNISSGTSTFLIPQDTILLAGKSVRFSTAVMGMSAGVDTTLRYPNNTLAPVVMPSVTLQTKTLAEPAQRRSVGSDEPRPGVAAASDTAITPQQAQLNSPANSQGLARAKAQSKSISGLAPTSTMVASVQTSSQVWEKVLPLWPYALGTLGLILIGIGLFSKNYSMKQVTNTPADEFDIEG